MPLGPTRSFTSFPLGMRLPFALLLLAACAPATTPIRTTTPAPSSTSTEAASLPTSVRWTQGSAEHRMLFEQVYAGATRALDSLIDVHGGGDWAVILDADETVIDNSEYQRRRAVLDSGFTAASWSAWVAEQAATTLPGADQFLRHVRARGGRVIIVTNRTQAECPDTRANFAALELATDLILCRGEGPQGSDKTARFTAVERGTAAAGIPPLRVLLWVGDNIQDFPLLTQTARDAGPEVTALFGSRYFILPNPMYGSWDR